MPHATATFHLLALVFHFAGFVAPYITHGNKFWDAPHPDSDSTKCTVFIETVALLADAVSVGSILTHCCSSEYELHYRRNADQQLLSSCCCSFIAGILKIIGCLVFGYFQTTKLCWSCCITFFGGIVSFFGTRASCGYSDRLKAQ
ncbi:hypothetical protein BaRGS_00019759 [Batillaria attramentaria]|uniref:Transmembrane protein n=1 Tax=Batillaria attramentaria TaxID=370345 RepID=A0ABD0KNZ2_9CAEN